MNALDALTAELLPLTSPRADISDLMVSKQSRVHDLIWDFSEDLVNRPRSIGHGRLRVNWEKWAFSKPLRHELQRIFALYHKAPSTLSKKSNGVKPQTLVAYIHSSLNFLRDAVQSFASADLCESLEQITLIDFREAAKIHPSSNPAIKRGLFILFHPFAAEVLDKRINITQGDIWALPISKPRQKDQKQIIREIEGPALFDDDLFALLSDEATGRVQGFMRLLGSNPEEKTNCQYAVPSCITEIPKFSQALEIYEQMRRSAKGLPHNGRASGYSIRTRLRKIVRPELLHKYLVEVNLAAQCVIGLYVGPRFSELASFRVGCLEERDGIWCMVGRVYKSKRDKNFTDDAWVAIPAVRDAVRVLERLECLKNNKFLFSSLDTAGGKCHGQRRLRNCGEPYAPNAFAAAMSRFIDTVDTQGRYAGWKFNSHQFKHSLTRQLVKAKVGLPYISFHLKHLFNRISTLPSEVTLGYGNAGKTYQSDMAGYQIQEVKRDLARKMYDPDSPVHGGAAPDFDARRKSYFKGATDSGLTKDQVIDELASLGDSSFVNVGLGYCSGRKDDPVTGAKPPCIGSLRCNPSRCANAIITKEAHGSAWKRIAVENRTMADDPRFAYAKGHFEAAAEEAEEVCSELGVGLDNG